MAKWKQVPVEPATDASDAAGAEAASVGVDIADWGMDSLAYLTVAGIDIPTAALALPLPVVALYLLFRWLSRIRNKVDPQYVPRDDDFTVGNAGPSGGPS